MKIRKNLSNLKFRMNLRNTLKKSSYEQILITKEECQREIEKRAGK